MEDNVNYWIGVASHDHVQNGLKEGICQLCHGKAAPLKRMKKGDWLIYYSGKEKFGDAKACQKFTALGQILDDEVYVFQMTPDFTPFRRRVKFFDAEETPIHPLIAHLEFITNKAKWGGPFRYGFLKIPRHDFLLIARAMQVTGV